MVYILPVYDKIYSYTIQKKQSIYWLTAGISSLVSILICYWLNQHSIYGTYATHSFLHCNILFYRTSIETDKDKKHRKFLASSIIWLILSIVSFATFFSMGYTSNYTTLPEIVNFHLLRFTGSCMILGIGFILNQITSTINYNVSIGTMVILGIHWMFIGVFNFAIEKIPAYR